MLIHFDIVCVDFQYLTELVDVAVESIVRMMLLPHFFSRASKHGDVPFWNALSSGNDIDSVPCPHEPSHAIPTFCQCRAPKSLGQGLVEYKRLIPYLLGPVHVSWLPLDLDLLPKLMLSWAFLKVIHVQRHCLLTYADNAMCTHHSLSPPV